MPHEGNKYLTISSLSFLFSYFSIISGDHTFQPFHDHSADATEAAADVTSPDADDDSEVVRSRWCELSLNDGDREWSVWCWYSESVGMSGSRSHSSAIPTPSSVSVSVSKFNSSALESELKGHSFGSNSIVSNGFKLYWVEKKKNLIRKKLKINISLFQCPFRTLI